MKRFCLLFILLSVHLSAFSQAKMKVLIDNAPFLLFERVTESKSHHHDYDKMLEDWHMYYVGKGTEVTVIDRSYYYTMLRVQLPDGSVGFMPTVSVVPAEEMNFTLSTSYGKVPAGNYTFLGIGPMKKIKNNTQSAAPEYYLYKNQDGTRYKLNIALATSLFSAPDDVKWLTSSNMDFLFRNFFKSHPEIDKNERDIDIYFKLKDSELPLNYIGYSKSYIDSVLGEPLSYAGPGISQYEGYTFAYYKNVGWDIEENKKLDDGGLLIYYDSAMHAVHMQKTGINWFYSRVFTPLYQPFKPGADLNPDIASEISASERAGRKVYRPVQPVKEIRSVPGAMSSAYVGALYLVERTFGVTNKWAIFGIMMLISCVVTLVLNLIISSLPLSNTALKTLMCVANLPIILYAFVYLSRLYVIAAFLAIMVIAGNAVIFMIKSSEVVDRNRCGRCKRWVNNPIVLDTKEDRRVSVSTPSITLGTGIRIGSVNSTGKVGDVTIRQHSHGTNFRTTVQLSWKVEKKVKCPLCGHVWKYTYTEMEEVRGPICYTSSTSSQVSWKEEQIIMEQIIRKSNREVLYEEEKERKQVTHVEEGPSSYDSRYDTKRYVEYLNRYLNGDYGALIEYESKYYGRYY